MNTGMDFTELILTRLAPMKDMVYGKNRGMTLLEVMIALMLLCVGIMGVAAMLDVSAKSNQKARTGVENNLAAAFVMEQVLALPYDDPRLEDIDDGFDPQQPDHGPFDIGSRSTTVEWEVHRDFPVKNTKRVFVTVRSKRGDNAFQGHRYDYVKARHLYYTSAVTSDD